MSSTPLEELRWAQSLADAGGLPTGMIVCADFRAPDFEHTIEAYRALGRVRAVWLSVSARSRFYES
jgi:hypothetical protein